MHAAWGDLRTDLSSRQIYYSRSEDSGITWGKNISVSSGDGYDYSPEIEICDGKMIMTWWKQVSGVASGVYVSTSDDHGSTWSPQVRISDTGSKPDLAVDSKCKIYLSYTDVPDIYVTMSKDAINWSKPVLVDHSPVGANNSTISVDRNDVIHLAWRDTRNHPEVEAYFNFSYDGIEWQKHDIYLSGSLVSEFVDSKVDIAYGEIKGENVLMAVWSSKVWGEWEQSYPYFSYWDGNSWSNRIKVSNSVGNDKQAFQPNIDSDNEITIVTWGHNEGCFYWEADRQIRAAYLTNSRLLGEGKSDISFGNEFVVMVEQVINPNPFTQRLSFTVGSTAFSEQIHTVAFMENGDIFTTRRFNLASPFMTVMGNQSVKASYSY